MNMHARSRLLLAGLLAALVLTIGVGSSSARRFSLSHSDFRVVYTPLEFISGVSTVRCNLTLEGSFHSRTIAKVAHLLAGHITRAQLGTCTGGSAALLTASLPWHRTYETFWGTLPNITELTFLVVGMSISLQPSGSLNCLFRTTTTDPGLFSEHISGGVITEATMDPSAEIPLTGSGGFCAFGGEKHIGGTGVVTRLGTNNAITVTLL
jgi:hypothetical protein